MTKEDVEKLLKVLSFQTDMIGGIWYRTFPGDVILEVDTGAEKFLYKKAGITVTGATTANFSQNENFVVFECVCRLLEKGYKPKDIELEPTWKLGHTEKSGRADIWIRTIDERGTVNSLIIIECKTAGREFEGAWRDTLADGAQLFSYFQQEGGTRFLCLYSSDLKNGTIASEYHLINVQDNNDYLKTLRKPKTFASASTVKERFAAWHDTYKCEFAKFGLFENDIAPYKPGKNKYSVADLREIDHTSMQKKYHEFATILRKHNVSGHENAFDKLVNLFLAKVVDEKSNAEDLKFYWKGIAYDDAYSLQDRLQFLYMVGMREFLGERVTYIDEETVKKAFGRFKNDPDATKDAILRYFRQLKFFSNNDFSFIEVHNERLFNENAAILRKVVQMLEDVKLKTDKPNQFLGDLFEGFLDHGVKQSEGQYFTPLPIVRFIISSLPIQAMLRDKKEPPRVIDYACGAGHFLNEYAQQVKRIARDMYGADIAEERAHYSAITGIEKEYRLSKVAKVSAFMYGEEDIQIIYADALAEHDKAPEGSFDVLVANPPYSVKGFLETLPEKERKRYELIKAVSDLAKQNSIETFFVERAVQLLKPTGIAAIILPSSILSNSGGIYVKCREIILKNFDIIAISEFGTGTFGKTGTNTITAFLRKKDAPPDFADHWRNRVEAWFAAKHEGDEVFGDASVLERYCNHRKFDISEYKNFLASGNASPTECKPNEKYPNLWASDAFCSYRAAFAKTKKSKKDDIVRLETDYIRTQEMERLYYFLLADSNPVDVLITKMPAKTKAAKEFLGYEWRTRKGDEGIKYIGVGMESNDQEDSEEEDSGVGAEDTTLVRNKGIEGIKTPLFNNANLFDENKINSLIRSNFNGGLSEIPEPLQPFIESIALVDLLDFDSSTFDKQIKTRATERIEIKSKYSMIKLGNVCTVVRGVTYKKEDQVSGTTDKIVLTADNITLDGRFEISKTINLRSDIVLPPEKILKRNDIFMCFSSGSKQHVGKACIIEHDTKYYAGGFMGILRAGDSILPKFLHELLNASVLRDVVKMSSHGTNIQNLSNAIGDLVIPLPPLDVQKKVVKECEKVDKEYNSSRMTIDEYRTKIAKILDNLRVVISSGGVIYKLSDMSLFSVQIGRRVVETEVSDKFDIPVYSANVFEPFGKIDRLLKGFEDFSVDSILWGIDGDWMVNCIEKGKSFYPTDHCGVLRVKTGGIEPKVLALALKIAGEAAGFKRSYRASIERVKSLTVALPPLAEQKKIAEEVSHCEAEIAKAQAVMDSASARKQEILRKHEIILPSSGADPIP